MTERTATIKAAELLAFADGRLPEARRAAVEAWLQSHPDQAAEVLHWQRQNEAMTALFDGVAKEPVPERLRPARIAANDNFGLRRLVAAAMVLLALGGAAGWFGRDLLHPAETPSQMLIASAVTAHSLYVRENRHAVEVAAGDHEHLVNWLSNRVTQPINPPDLAPEGFRLVGGRLLPVEYGAAGPAAQLMYENAAAERVTVFITAALPGGDKAYEFTRLDRLDAFYWANDKITCTVVGDLPEEQMQALAKKVYQQLTWRPDPAVTGI